MSSAQATVHKTVVMTTTVGTRDATRAATVFTVLAITQLIWFAALVYGAIWLLA
jgi:hypothetical protein